MGAVCRRDDAVLLHRMVPESWWAVPGGRVEPGEIAEEAMARELLEELGLALTPGRLLAVIETRFSHNGVRFEEVGLYFEVEARGVPETPFSRQDGDALLEFEWFRIDDLEDRDIRPRCVLELLKAERDEIIHLVQRDSE